MLSIEMLPAGYGDALWLAYGDPAQPRVVIVDCGFKDNYRELISRTERLAPGQLELLVLTHVDEDHIKGAIPLLADPRFARHKGIDIWFNGWDHLVEAAADGLGAVQGEFFSALIKDGGFAWNAARPWGGRAIVVPDDGPLPSGRLPGGLDWTLLSPTRPKLSAMRDFWHAEVEAAELLLQPGDHEGFLELFGERASLQPDALGGRTDIERLAMEDFKEDNREPNGSSIALLVEFEGRALLLGGDAHPSVLTTSLQRLAAERGVSRIRIDALKVPHHGSAKNTSPELLDLLNCDTYLFSSSGAKHGHPSPACVARIIASRDEETTLRFNYDSDANRRWADRDLQEDHRFTALYPAQGGDRLVLAPR